MQRAALRLRVKNQVAEVNLVEAVNLALALHSSYGQTALVDLAPLVHAALHMNLKPVFTVTDAGQPV